MSEKVPWEEINDGIAGSNYGWSNCEGFCSPTNPNYRDPLFRYGHGSDSTTGCAITGGTFYNPAVVQFPASYVGKYFYNDYCSGWIRVMDPATNTATGFATGISNPVDLKVGPDGSLFYLARGGNGQVWKVRAPTPTPTPSPVPVAISGTAFYCSNTTPARIPSVTLTLTGTMSGSTLTDGSGNYTFSALTSGGNYTVTPSKAALLPGSAGITTVDIIATQGHFLNQSTLTGCRLSAADVNGDSSVNTIDVIAIQKFFLGASTGLANVGQYQFNPTTRTYTGVNTSQTGQNYDAIVFGDVAPPFVH